MSMPSPQQLHEVPNEQWEQPLPLHNSPTLPPFPVDALPDWMAAEVEAVAVATQTPLDLPGCLALATLSTAAGGRAMVQIREAWQEPINIYTVVVLEPSARKTPVFKAMTRPLIGAERELVEAAKPAIEQARITRRSAEQLSEQAEREVTSVAGGEREQAVADAVSAAVDASEIEIPPTPRLIIDDITPETVATLLDKHGGRLAELSDEGGIFATIAGRYSGTPNLDNFLKAHSASPIRVDRAGRQEHIHNPALTIGLAVQPAIVGELGKTGLLRGSGFLSRFLFALPESTVGRRQIRAPAVPKEVSEAYDNRVRLIVHTLADWTDPAVFAFTDEADDLMAEIETEIEPKLDPVSGAWAHLNDWGGKQAGQIARIAGLLHAAKHPRTPWRFSIEPDTVAAARRIGDYFAKHAITAFDRLGADPSLAGARHLLSWIERTRPASFTARDAHKANRGTIPLANDIKTALAVLEDYGHIQRQPPPEREPGQRGRSPSPTFWTHPMYR